MRALILASLLVLAGPAQAQAPDTAPILRPNLAMHTAAVGDASADAACTRLATASDDKTVKLWSLPDGRLLRTLRPPIGRDALAGQIFAVAQSPDGRLVAAGGRDPAAAATGRHGLWLFEAETGRVVRRLDGFEGEVLALRFSADGARLAVGLLAGGVRVFEVGSGAERLADRGPGGAVYGVAFLPDGGLVAASYDGKVRRYDAAGAKAAESAPRPGQRPKRIAVDPAGGRIALGYDRFPAIDLLDGAALTPLSPIEIAGARSDFALAFSGDGRRLGAAGIASDAAGERPAVIDMALDGTEIRVETRTPIGATGFWNLAPCGADGFAFAMTEPRAGLVRNGAVALDLVSAVPDMVGKRLFADRERLAAAAPAAEGLTASPDLKRLRFGLRRGAADPVQLDLVTRVLARVPDTTAPGLKGPDTTSLRITDWAEKPSYRLKGDIRPLLDGWIAHSLSIDRAGRGFMLGINAGILGFTAGGDLFAKALTPAPAHGVILSDDARLVAAALGDGTIRWYRTSDGAELLALLVDRDTLDWVAFTPSGYYAASPGGDRLIGWHVNRGPDEAADFFAASRFRDRFYRPDVVEAVLDTADEAAALKAADARRRAPPRLATARPAAPPASPPPVSPEPATPLAPVTVADILPPALTLLSPPTATVLPDAPLTLRFSVRSPSAPADRVEALFDGRPSAGARGLSRAETETPASAGASRGGDCPPLAGARGLERPTPEATPESTPPAGGSAGEGMACAVSLVPPAEARTVSLVAYAGDRASEAVTVALAPAPSDTPSPAPPARPRLRALLVGVSGYDQAELRLDWAAQDARDIEAALARQRGGLYADVSVRLLADDAASGAAIRDGLDWLARETTARDVAFVFLAGHGWTGPDRGFFYLPVEADREHVAETSVDGEEIRTKLRAIPGKVVYLVDACHSADAARERRASLEGTGLDDAGPRGRAGFADAFRRRILRVAGGAPDDDDSGALGTPGQVDMTALVDEMTATENGVVMLSSSTGTQLSQEDAAWENGAFTEALLAGLAGEADEDGDRTLSFLELGGFVSARVRQLTKRQQQPVVGNLDLIPDFPLALVP